MQDVLRTEQAFSPPPARLETARRYLAIWFPFLSADRVRKGQGKSQAGARPAETPLVFIAKERGGLRIVAIDQAAHRSGLPVGMTLADARARAPGLAVEAMDEHADRELLLRCAAAVEFFTPLAALDSRDGLILDITGCAHLFGGETGLAAQAGRRFARLGLTIRLAFGATPDAARALAHFGPANLALPGEEERIICGLSAAALGMSAEITIALARAGLKTLGDLAARPTGALSARFGTELTTRLRRTLGQEDIRITPLRPAPDCIVERRFPEPLTNGETLLVILDGLAGKIAELLERRGQGGWLFEAVFFRADGAVRRLTVEMGQASRDPASLTRLLRLRLDTLADPLDPGFGFDAIRLSVLRAEPLAPTQTSLDSQQQREDGDIAGLIDRLVTRFGRDRVLRYVARDTHDPQRAGATTPVGSRIASAAWPAPEAGAPPARPIQLFDPPQAIETLAETPDGPPLRFRWRRVLHEIARAEGPERIAPEWWRVDGQSPATRDYFSIEDTGGRRFWVFRQGLYGETGAAPRWFLHGLFA